MNKFKVTFLPDNVVYEAAPGMTIFKAAIDAGIYIDSPCGGNGYCGNCKVNIVKATGLEEVLACQTEIVGDITVQLPETGGHRILEEAVGTEFSVGSMISRDESGKVFFEDKEIGKCEKSKTLCVMAFDIGTTTVVGYLLDAESGNTLSTVSVLNPQSQFGADVIARANYAIENGKEVLANVIRKALMSLIEEAVDEAKISKEQVFLVTVVGNTCMHHLFLGIPTQSLVLAPYHAASVKAELLKAKEYGFSINENAILMVLPNISGFVGADTVGAILSSGVDKSGTMSLLIDIGTNGEMVVGNKERLCSCSTAAGPAFEGAKISSGMRGTKGAIDHADFTGDDVKVSVIGGVNAIGVCGSGLIDIIAGLVEIGFIEETGRLVSADEVTDEKKKKFAKRIGVQDGAKVFWLTEDVCITQKDIREVQLAKAAIAAGIELLMRKRGVGISDIERVMLAGAFGNYMSPHGACTIGLIPKELESKIMPIGNAAGQGSKMAALSKTEFLRSVEIGKNTEYMELAGMPEFNDVFMDKMEF